MGAGSLPRAKFETFGHQLQVDDSSAAALRRYAPTSVERSRSNDEDDAAFLALYQNHFGFVWRTVAGLAAGSSISVEDAVQDVWLTVARRLADFRGESAHRTWLFAVAKNVVRNHRRRWLRKGGLERLDETTTSAVAVEESEALRARAVWHDVRLFMATLDDAQREVFLSRFLLEMAPREVATVTGRSIVAVYAETRRLKAAFKRWHLTREDETR